VRALPERVVWQVSRDGHFAEARVRDTRSGRELRILAGGELVWSRRFRSDAEAECESAARAIQIVYEADCWRVVGV
jgi:hypothetical protein